MRTSTSAKRVHLLTPPCPEPLRLEVPGGRRQRAGDESVAGSWGRSRRHVWLGAARCRSPPSVPVMAKAAARAMLGLRQLHLARHTQRSPDGITAARTSGLRLGKIAAQRREPQRRHTGVDSRDVVAAAVPGRQTGSRASGPAMASKDSARSRTSRPSTPMVSRLPANRKRRRATVDHRPASVPRRRRMSRDSNRAVGVGPRERTREGQPPRRLPSRPTIRRPSGCHRAGLWVGAIVGVDRHEVIGVLAHVGCAEADCACCAQGARRSLRLGRRRRISR